VIAPSYDLRIEKLRTARLMGVRLFSAFGWHLLSDQGADRLSGGSFLGVLLLEHEVDRDENSSCCMRMR
jgi:hypothetical protein